jgi:hypothetical protein
MMAAVNRFFQTRRRGLIMSPQPSPDPEATDEASWPDEDRDDAAEADDTDGFYPARPGGAPPWPTPPAWDGSRPREPRRPGVRPGLIMAAVAVAAAAAGAAVAVGVDGASASSAGTVTTPASPPAAAAPGAGGGNGFPPPGAGGGSGSGEQMLAAGKVTAVNGTSITVSGNGSSITAAITSATSFTGSVKSAGHIKVGDLVMIDISVNGAADTAASIQDPLAGNGSLP